MPCVVLAPNLRHRVLEGHLWIYRSEIQPVADPIVDGDTVDVVDVQHRFIGRGYYNSLSQIVVRVLAREPVDLDEAFFRRRLEQALAYRERRCPGRAARRLVHSEADLLPGLIVDQYGDFLVLQTTTLGMDRLKPLWVRLLKERLAPRAIIERNDTAVRRLEGLPAQQGVLAGATDGLVRVCVGKAEFVCNLFDPHKTGLYLDQQENYERVAGMVGPGMRVLDVFCHQAGFAIHALLAGAAEALAVDSSESSLALARQSAEYSGVGNRIQWVAENAFDVLRKYQKEGRLFDLVILDPPSFTRTRKAVSEARRGYKEIHVRALRLLAPGGCLATFCCSHHVSAGLFHDIILEAARDVGVILRRDLILGAGADHPVLPALPETEYLKGYGMTVLDQAVPVRRSHRRTGSRQADMR